MKTLRILAVPVVLAVWLSVGEGVRAQAPGKSSDPAAQEMTRLQGTWKAVGYQFSGQRRPKKVQGLTYVVSGSEATLRRHDKVEGQYRIKVDPAQRPHQIDQTTSDGKTYHGIYRLSDSTLTVCLPTEPGAPRPRQFATKAGDGHVLRSYRKVKEDTSGGTPGAPSRGVSGR